VRIRSKIVAVVLPLMIGALVVVGASAFFVATNAVSNVTSEFLDFKTDQLSQYIDGQWRILVENDLATRDDMVQAAQAGIEVFARSILRSDTELIFAVDPTGTVAMSTAPLELPPPEAEALLGLPPAAERSLADVRIAENDRVASWFAFEAFEWRVFVTETRETFYSDLNRITTQTTLFTLGAVLVTAVVLILLVATLTKPMTQLASAMRTIISSNDLSSRVDVHFRDEVGELSKTFNVMVSELDKAYGRIKSYAYDAVLSQKKEQRIRNIFQKYVPQELIDQFFAHPESMLVGDNRELSVLFSDIRSFTSISEQMQPDVLVSSLNRYFSVMVELIMDQGGVIDKYIGDAIMAFFGAPVHHEDDALNSVHAGISMVEALDAFNEGQKQSGLPEFKIGVGINYGVVTVGNIGTDRKMDYTVIGDMVNVASRLEGLTKPYHQSLIISEVLKERIGDSVPSRIVDSVAVKGRSAGLRIYTVKRTLTPAEEKGWPLHNQAMGAYYDRRFAAAIDGFAEAEKALGDDYLTQMMVERCKRYVDAPPPADWSGVEIMTSK
jgi:adenylate cyclase